MIDIANLEPGDLIFQYIGSDTTDPATIESTHVMIYLGNGISGLPTMVHQIGTSMLPKGTHIDVLVPNKRVAELSQRKRIVRCNSSNLARKAVECAVNWQKRFQVSFGEERAGHSETFENRIKSEWKSIEGLVYVHRRLFESVGKYRAIKYAARRNGYLCYPGEEDYPGKGMHCSMFATICYQVAGLSEVVEAADANDSKTRVADKKMYWRGYTQDRLNQPVSTINAQDWLMYSLYVRTLCESDFYQVNKPDAQRPTLNQEIKYVPGVSYWKGKSPITTTSWDQLITKGMRVDAKVIKATSLYHSLRLDKDGWKDLGDLTGKQGFEDKTQRTVRLQNHSDVMKQARRDWLRK